MLGLATVAAAGLFLLTFRRPLWGSAVTALAVPLSAGLQRGTLTPIFKPSEAIVLVVLAGVLAHQATTRRIRPLDAADLAVGGYAIGSVAVPWVVQILTPHPADLETWWTMLSPVFFLAAYYIFSRGHLTEGAVRVVLNTVMLAGVIVGAIAAAELANLPGVRSVVETAYPAPALSSFRPGSTLGSYNAVGAFGALTFTLALAIAASRWRGYPRLWLTVVMAGGLLGAIASQTWAALAVLPIITLIVVAFARSIPRELAIAAALGFAVLALSARDSKDSVQRALGAAAVAIATMLILLGATAQYLNLTGLSETVAMLFGVAAGAATQASGRRVASVDFSRGPRWSFDAQAEAHVLATAGFGANPFRVRPAPANPTFAVRREDVLQPAAREPLPRIQAAPDAAPPAAQRVVPPPISLPSVSPQRRGFPRPFRIVAIVTIAVLALVVVRIGAVFTSTDDQLLVQVGNQAIAPVDLRQSIPVSPYLFGANVFPASGTTSIDRQSGFMSYGPQVVDGLRSADVKLLRFPGGSWGEEHLLSLDQLDAFSSLLSRTGAQGMIQARLSGTTNNTVGLANQTDRAHLAGRWVDYMNNIHSDLRTGVHASALVYPVRLWTVGNEPDLTINTETGKPYTVDQYVKAFIEFSIQMHQNDPRIQVFGPEISRFGGLGAGPQDASGHLWMETFLAGVGDYEKANPGLGYHLLDGVSFHFYPEVNARDASTGLMTNAEQWSYLLEPLRHLIRQTLDRDAPLAVTEINSFATINAPPAGLSALWWADTLGMLMNQQVNYLAFFAAQGVDSPYPLFRGKQVDQTVMLRVLQLYAHLQPNLIPLASQRNPVSIYATQSDSHQDVSLLFINKANVAQLAQVRGQNQFLGISSWAKLDVSVPPYSITLVAVHHRAGADAFSFYPLKASDNNLPPLTHTVCGQNADALAYQIPC